MSPRKKQEPPIEPVEEAMEQEPIGQEAAAEEELRQGDETVFDAFMRHQKHAAEETRLALEALIPDGFRVHSREAKRAFKRSFKVVLADLSARLEAMDVDDAEEDEPPSTTGKTKVRVEVS